MYVYTSTSGAESERHPPTYRGGCVGSQSPPCCWPPSRCRQVVDGTFDAVEGVEEEVLAAGEVEPEEAGVGLAEEGRAVGEDEVVVGAEVLGEIVCLAEEGGGVEPEEVGCFGDVGDDEVGAAVGREEVDGDVAVRAEVVYNCASPVLAVAVRGSQDVVPDFAAAAAREDSLRRGEAEGRALGLVSSRAEVAPPQVRVRDDGEGEVQRGDVVRLRRRRQHDQPLAEEGIPLLRRLVLSGKGDGGEGREGRGLVVED
mmetsp:Transcript_11569/g.38033  ORF Transcript_11569/g.38033 Transcript_11569/m.38033 type:complete len:256 (-) Transcript_11569:773-1540(-)